MAKALGIGIAVVALIAALGFGARFYANRAMSSRAVTPKTLGSTTPASVGLPFSRVAVEAGDRTLIGWWVRARADSGRVAPAVLFLHGNRSSISDYVELQRFLYRQGISSLVYDYSGFGASGGSPSLTNAIADAGNAARLFADSAGQDARKVAMGSGLGATVLLQAIDSVQPHVSGIVIEGVDASVNESAVRSGQLPKLVARLVAEIGDNVGVASRVRVPLLAVHSYADARVPIEDAQKVVAAVPSQSSLVRHWRKGHSALLSSSRPCDWAPVLSFVKAGTLPKTKIDTTDACKVEAAQLAAAKAAAAKAAAAKQTVTPAGTTKSPGTKSPGTKTGSKTQSRTPPPAKRPS
ncbi:MAG: alpha/beta hydrolase [Gemmatimonadaceae bacterium]